MLSSIQHFCRRTGLPRPGLVYGSSDTQILQIMELLEEEGNDLAKRGPWQGITFEATHTSTAAEDQGAITAIATNGFSYIKNGTFWDRTDKLPMWGPVDSKEWQELKGFVSTGPRYQWRIRGGKLLINPTMAASHTLAFEYVSENWILDNDSTTYKSFFTEDTDTILLPENLVLLGLRWRWAREKGMPYAELMRTYEMQVTDALGRDGGKRTLNMDGNGRRTGPGIFVRPGSWSL